MGQWRGRQGGAGGGDQCGEGATGVCMLGGGANGVKGRGRKERNWRLGGGRGGEGESIKAMRLQGRGPTREENG